MSIDTKMLKSARNVGDGVVHEALTHNNGAWMSRAATSMPQ